VIAVLSTITVAHRIYYTWLQTERAGTPVADAGRSAA
jgi:hypothetical protein